MTQESQIEPGPVGKETRKPRMVGGRNNKRGMRSPIGNIELRTYRPTI